MVRSVDWVLREYFGKTFDDAHVIDPCCGVGTFFRHIERNTPHQPKMLGMELMAPACKIARCLLERAKIIDADWLSDMPIETDGRTLVIIGNPPYSGHSSNTGKIDNLIADYRKDLIERNPKWLADDYVKFIRMAQHQIERTGRGVIAFITNHSYLFNPTFRSMRKSLARTFDEIFALDLGGNIKRLDRKDENVFPIQMGVAISLFVKTSDDEACTVRYSNIVGKKRDKLNALSKLNFDSVAWRNVPLVEPFYAFVAQNNSLREEFYGHASLFEIFDEHTMGFVTSRDKLAIGFTKNEIIERVGIEHNDEIVEVLYRPFDRRWAHYSRDAMERPRLPFMNNLMRDNVAIAIGRAGQVTGSDEWDVAFVTDMPADLNLFRRGGAKLFPRFVYRGDERVSNMRIDGDQNALFGYIYALLHSREYRARYAEFLALDYPRIPISCEENALCELASLGWHLIDTHLMRRNRSAAPYCQRHKVSSSTPTHFRPANECNSIIVGGYCEPEKCLKDRAKLGDVGCEEALRSAIADCIKIQDEIDCVVSKNKPWQKSGGVSKVTHTASAEL